MEHTINLELKLNDDQMICNAMNKATEELKKQLKSTIFDKKYSWGHDSTVLNRKGEEIVKEWLNENKQELYELIAQKVAMSVMRSKKFRDILEEEIGKE
jgi:ribosomal protein L29